MSGGDPTGPLVLPVGALPTDEGPVFVLMARLPNGLVELGVAPSWSDAAAALAPKLNGAVRCGESLTLHAKRFGWEPVHPGEADLLEAAGFAVLLVEQLPPDTHDALTRYCRAWVNFFRLRLWEQLPGELAIHTIWTHGGVAQTTCLSVLGQAGKEFGLAHYEDVAAFDAMWSGAPFQFDGLSVLASDTPDLAPAFQPLGVPAPALTRLVRSMPEAPRLADYALATAAMELLVGVLTGELGPIPLGDGATLELKREEAAKPKKRASTPKKKTPKKKTK